MELCLYLPWQILVVWTPQTTFQDSKGPTRKLEGDYSDRTRSNGLTLREGKFRIYLSGHL